MSSNMAESDNMNISRIQEMLGLASTAAGLGEKTTEAVSALRQLLSRARLRRDSPVVETLNKIDVDLAAAAVVNAQLRTELRNLSDELLKAEEFEKEKSRYELVETSEGDYVFRIKSNMADEQPIHYICPVSLNRDKTISFIGGRHRRLCQTDRKHVFNFGKTAPVATSRVRH